MKEQILAVQRMQDYIEQNKTEEIRLADLARASLFSVVCLSAVSGAAGPDACGIYPQIPAHPGRQTAPGGVGQGH